MSPPRVPPLVTVALAVLVALLGAVASPLTARACACGAAPGAEVTGERALLTFDGTTQQMDLRFELGRSTQRAGWIMPAPPSTQLALGTADWQALSRATAPVVKHRKDWTPRLGSGGSDRAGGADRVNPPSSVQVTTVDIGPFRVSTLSGTDASAVSAWLTEHEFETADEQLPTFQGYLDRGWQIQAVALIPTDQGTFRGVLPSLRMTFPTNEIVYPMELSKHAANPQSVTLYVAAPFQVTPAQQASSETPLTLTFAGEVAPSVVGRTTGLGGSESVQLTAFEAVLQPSGITGDYVFEKTASAPYQRVIWVTDTTPGEVLGVVLLFGVPLLAAAGVIVLLLWRGRSRVTPAGTDAPADAPTTGPPGPSARR